ncbi:MAG: hypothetical protein R3A45_08515 [Bdellovibrionota bacterium]
MNQKAWFQGLSLFLAVLIGLPPVSLANGSKPSYDFEVYVEKQIRGAGYFMQEVLAHQQFHRNAYFAQEVYDSTAYINHAPFGQGFQFDRADQRVRLVNQNQTSGQIHSNLYFRYRLIKNQSGNYSLMQQVQAPISKRFVTQFNDHPIGQLLTCSENEQGCKVLPGADHVYVKSFVPWLPEKNVATFYQQIWPEDAVDEQENVMESNNDEMAAIQDQYLQYLDSLPDEVKGTGEAEEFLRSVNAIVPDMRKIVAEKIFEDDLFSQESLENVEKQLLALFSDDPLLVQFLSNTFRSPHELGLILLQTQPGSGGSNAAIGILLVVATVAIGAGVTTIVKNVLHSKVSLQRLKRESNKAKTEAEKILAEIDKKEREVADLNRRVTELKAKKAQLEADGILDVHNDPTARIEALKNKRKKLKKEQLPSLYEQRRSIVTMEADLKTKVGQAGKGIMKKIPMILLTLSVFDALANRAVASAQAPQLPNASLLSATGLSDQGPVGRLVSSMIKSLRPELLDPTWLQDPYGVTLQDLKPLFFVLTWIHMQLGQEYPNFVQDLYTNNLDAGYLKNLVQQSDDCMSEINLFALNEQNQLVFSEAFYASAKAVSDAMDQLRLAYLGK